MPPSVDAAQAVDRYLLDEQLVYDGDVFGFLVAVISTHFIKTFLPNGIGTCADKNKGQPARG
jgi:hypothetical protein